ncbi:hypothetical protein [Clostridium pasteurianum]|uniref:Uncharacterized protein n=1 Tax=Clostridium pasteurianum BC1 TaxID=86416 RepID=R4K8U1_CLOPA|nr:hypothetical protein [Clostridium pasteurianum]AGK99587.1 hypothetical protein Clopa_4914 [Clostridium pasteurianum BC1]
MAKREGSFTFTFSKRNNDVKEIIAAKKKENKDFVTTDYMCEAVRFYEKYGKNNADLRNLVVEIMRQELPNAYVPTAEEIDNTSSHIFDASFNGNINDIDESCLEED